MAKSTSTRLEVAAEEDAPRATATGTSFRLHEDSHGMKILTEIREAEPGSDREAELAHKLAKLDDVHNAVSAVTELITTANQLGAAAKGFGRGIKVILVALTSAIAANPVIGSVLQDDTEAIDRIEDKIDAATEERRALAAWLWDIERCRQDPLKNPCPTEPPAPIRIMLAEDELGR